MSYNGITSDFQSDDEGSIPFTCFTLKKEEMINKGTNYLTREQQKKLDEILKICNDAIEGQKKRENTRLWS